MGLDLARKLGAGAIPLFQPIGCKELVDDKCEDEAHAAGVSAMVVSSFSPALRPRQRKSRPPGAPRGSQLSRYR
jgi:hypothetical protein